MQKTEQRAFAAVSPEGFVIIGWRIRPVFIRVEDEGEGR